MTSPRSVRVVATSLVLGVTAALLTAGSGPGAAAEQRSAPSARGHHHGHGHHHQHGHHGHQGHGKVVWDSTYYYAGSAPVAAHGKVPGGKRKVRLQVKLPGGWRTIAKTRSSRHGKFSIATQLDWYGTHTVRVATSGRHAFKRSTTVQVFISYAPRGNPADHVFTPGESGLRYSFDPCKTVRYVVNADDVGPNGILLAQLGMAQLSWATGIKVQYAGTSHQIPFQTDDTRLPTGQNLLIAWADESELPAFVTTPAIGFGGSFRVFRARDGGGHPVLMSTQAATVFDTNAYLSGNYDQGWAGTKPAWGETILHELGHAFGLAHSPAADEIMYWQAGNGAWPDGLYRGIYDAGDLTGLSTNGLAQGCFHKVNHFRQSARVADPKPQP